MERKPPHPSLFVDLALAELGSRRAAAFFASVDAVVDWAALARAVADVFVRDPHAPGRPHTPLVLLVKCLFLAKWFDLSDPGLEEQLNDRVSWRRWVGLGGDEPAPDETTFVTFRGRLRAGGHERTLFDAVHGQLERAGVAIERGTVVDATIIRASRGTRRPDGTTSGDPDATSVRQYGRTEHGYKAHLATDPRGLIKHVAFDTARVHESNHFDALSHDEPDAVFADAAYWSKRRVRALRQMGVYPGIARKALRDRPLSAAARWLNRKLRRVRAALERTIGLIKHTCGGYRRARYRGLARNAFDWTLRAAAANVRLGTHLRPRPA